MVLAAAKRLAKIPLTITADSYARGDQERGRRDRGDQARQEGGEEGPDTAGSGQKITENNPMPKLEWGPSPL